MKLFEKLAIEAARETGCSECGYQGFIAGFRKAREMAYELMAKGDPRCFELDVDMEGLGETEVEG